MLLGGAELRHIFAWQDPFRSRPRPDDGPGEGPPEQERDRPWFRRSETGGDVTNGLPPGEDPEPSGLTTILAANANYPLELQLRAFCRAAADWPGSPLIVQFSHNALRTIGGGQDAQAMASGARLARFVLEHTVKESEARYVAPALDHFRVPPYPGDGGEGSSRAVRVARAAVDDAYEAARGVVGEVPDAEIQAYVVYLSSPAYTDFKRAFAAVLTALEPAWAMIDTEKLPPVLDHALTRDVVDFTRKGLGLAETMLEAEYGATGVAGEAQDYHRLEGPDLAGFAEEVACFVTYTGADGISYPVGMEHGAPAGERHEPDEDRLKAVQARLRQAAGRYVPFAQHGGTGAARLLRGWVGKNNVNTLFLVTAANHIADRVIADVDRIRAGVKEACGTGLYTGAVEAVREATVRKLREAGSFGAAPQLDRFGVG
jgi:fructose/tagatose bisphosphate aldolase